MADKIELVGASPEDYPLQKKEHSEEFLREIAHLRPRTSAFAAVLRARHVAGQALTGYLNDDGFVQVHTPVIVAGDCEGAGEQFVVSDGQKDPFFGTDSYLTVSGQLHAEAFAGAMSRVYTFGPTFRAERHSKTAHHLAEFWMLEPEMAFANLDLLVELAEGTTKAGLKALLGPGQADLAAAGASETHLERLQGVVASSFARMTYSEAIEILVASSHPFVKPVEWGMDLQREHERYLCEQHCADVPVFVTDYPAAIKPFYAKKSTSDERCVAAVDLLVPGIGELIGGSVREDDYDTILAVMEERGMQTRNYEWYLDLRKFGSGQTAGFGLGFERFLQWTTGVANIRDVSPCPRWSGHIRM